MFSVCCHIGFFFLHCEVWNVNKIHTCFGIINFDDREWTIVLFDRSHIFKIFSFVIPLIFLIVRSFSRHRTCVIGGSCSRDLYGLFTWLVEFVHVSVVVFYVIFNFSHVIVKSVHVQFCSFFLFLFFILLLVTTWMKKKV